MLRSWIDDDVPAIVAACSDPEIPRWIHVIPHPYTERDARDWLERCEHGAEGHQFAITGDHAGELLGAIGLGLNELNQFGHIGYWVAAGARGHGVATRALRLVSEWGARELGLGRLELIVEPDNLPSQRVAEKAGFRREGVLRAYLRDRDGGRRDVVMFSLLPDEL